ncbi:20775_t:CDS:2 [Cetraspora pellucida]|uniref:20775_t:CDS:1 n=1 Tax=Cetraspora pellucida TaxID=1433469 RepID=A0A9N9PHZ3_9GLOM|nr:20775_t:CDS:2 [Cetraspora pellucida]
MNEWEKWRKNPDQVKLYQFMWKDNIPFHTVMFPCSLLGTDEEWTLLHHITTTVFGDDAKDTEIPVSVWRYYLMSSRPETSDFIFTWKEFITRHNTELLANLENFVNCVMKFVTAKYDSTILSCDSESEQTLIKNINNLLTNILKH